MCNNYLVSGFGNDYTVIVLELLEEFERRLYV